MGRRRKLSRGIDPKKIQAFNIPLEKLTAEPSYLIIPDGESTKGEDWRKGVMQVKSLNAVKRSIGLLKKRGYSSGKVLAPKSEQEEKTRGFVVIGDW